jgi:hypothetical protein
MPVKCLNATEKADIGNKYLFFGNTVSSLSYEYKRSRRTIIRVLEERGITHTRSRIPKEINKAEQAVIDLNAQPFINLKLTPPGHGMSLLAPTHAPWYRRFMDWLNTPVKFPTFS